MPSAAFNAIQIFRPLWAGVAITSDAVKSYGTIGCFASDAAGAPYLVTATHVVVSSRPQPAERFSVFQPDYRLAYARVCSAAPALVDATGEVIAVQVDPGVARVAAIVGIGPCSGVGAPGLGDIVVKSGTTTATTLGRITNVGASEFEVQTLRSLPPGYEGFAGGDSGAAWVMLGTGTLVGIHVGEVPPKRARAIRLDRALQEMSLTLEKRSTPLP